MGFSQDNITQHCYVEFRLENQILISLPVSCISSLLCLTTLISVCILKLHKKLVYRLAIYQVLSALTFSLIWICLCTYEAAAADHLFPNYTFLYSNASSYVVISPYKIPFVLLGSLLLGSAITKAMFTVWISIHLFALAVFHRNLKRLERLYVGSSIFVSLLVTIIVMALGYKTCVSVDDAVYIAVFGILVAATFLVIVMGIILCRRACRRRSASLAEYEKHHKKALCEMLPLIMYPILFFIFTIPIAIFSTADYSSTAEFFFISFAPFWSFTTSLLLIIHIFVVWCVKKKKLLRIKNALMKAKLRLQVEEGSVTINETTRLCQKSNTHYSAPIEE